MSWLETVSVDYSDGNQQEYSRTMTGTLDAYQRVNAQTAENYTFTSADKVTIEVSDLKVTLKSDEPEVVAIDATATLSRDTTTDTTMNAQVVVSEQVGGYATFTLQRLADGSDTWTTEAVANDVPFFYDTANYSFTGIATTAGYTYRVVVTDVDGLVSVETDGIVTFEAMSEVAVH